jgi:phospholipid transport system transporter-binding protein
MKSEATIKFENDRLMVSGDLDFISVVNLWNDSLPLFNSHSELNFDFLNVNSSNSAGLSLLIEWMKLARKTHKKIKFSNVPSQLVSIARVCGVDGFLG